MNARGIEARIIRLESRRRGDGEFYLMWRQPGEDMKSAIAAAHLSRGTKVICPEWFGELPLPPGRWVGADARLPKHEKDYVYQSVVRHMAKRGISEDDLRMRGRERGPDPVALEMTDLELEFAIFGVTAQ